MTKYEMDDRVRPIVERVLGDPVFAVPPSSQIHTASQPGKLQLYNFDTCQESLLYVRTIRTPHEVLFPCTLAAKF